jgi:hypothetical protein
VASQGRSLRQLLIKALQLSGEPIEAVGRVSIDGGFTRVSRFGRGYHRGPMEPLQILSALASLALISGVFIALLQLRGLRAQRHLEQVLRAYQPFLEENLTRAYWHVHHWDYRAYEDFAARATTEDWTDLDQVTTFFEMMGVMYKRGVADIDLLDDLFAGSAVLMWSRVAPLVRGYRDAFNVRDYGLRFEVLAVALDARLTARGEPHASIA